MTKLKWLPSSCFCCHVTGLLYSDWLSSLLLYKVEAIFFFKFPHSFVICKRVILRDLFENDYHSSVNCDADSKCVLHMKGLFVTPIYLSVVNLCAKCAIAVVFSILMSSLYCNVFISFSSLFLLIADITMVLALVHFYLCIIFCSSNSNKNLNY